MESRFYYDTVIGKICIREEDGALTGLFFGDAARGGEERETDLLRTAAAQLREYLAGDRRDFDLPLAPRGTAFQRVVWEALQQIPYGETRSYGQIAAAVGNPKGGRAVGMANNRNPISIIVPCHRVIGADGSLTGYGGGLDIKRRLLNLERGVVGL